MRFSNRSVVVPGSGRIVASQHRTRLAHDSQGWRGAGASRFRFGGKKEAAGVCRGCGESMEFQSQTADTERVITLLDKADGAILSGPWPQYMAQCSVRGACGFVLADKLSGSRLERVPSSGPSQIHPHKRW